MHGRFLPLMPVWNLRIEKVWPLLKTRQIEPNASIQQEDKDPRTEGAFLVQEIVAGTDREIGNFCACCYHRI